MIERYKVGALICMPINAGSNEMIQLDQIEQAVKSRPYLVPKASSSCVASTQVPPNSLNPAFLELEIIDITWP
jgi:hypothetical protein